MSTSSAAPDLPVCSESSEPDRSKTPPVDPTSTLEWLKVEQVAEKLQVSPKLIRKLISTGRMQARRVGRLLRVHRSELEKLLPR